MRPKLVVVAAVVLLGSACAGSDTVSVAEDGSVSTSGSTEEFCGLLESDGETLFGGEFTNDLGSVLGAIDTLRNAAPSEIRGDMNTLADVAVTMAEAFEGLESDDPEALGQMMEIATDLEGRSVEIETASTNVEAWARANCELPEGFAEGSDDFLSGLSSDASGYGDDPELDALWDECAAGELASCDALWFGAPIGSEYESFGDSCGETEASSSGGCEFNAGEGGDTGSGFDSELDGPQSYGDDADLDDLWDECSGGDLSACDSLYYSSPIDSEYEKFAVSCGGTSVVDRFGTCATGVDGEPQSYGDDPELDRLHDACEAGELGACDDLYFGAPIGSDYEFFGETCGGRTEDTAGFCADPGDSANSSGDASTYGDDAALDALWDDCDGGDLDACDDLWWESPVGSEYEVFAESCGGRSSEPLFADCAAKL